MVLWPSPLADEDAGDPDLFRIGAVVLARLLLCRAKGVQQGPRR